MSCLNCDSCGRIVDTDENPEAFEIWEPDPVCDECFNGMESYEVWNACIAAIRGEMKYKKPEQLADVLKGLEK